MDSSRHNYNFRLLEGISYIIRHIICLASEGYTHFSAVSYTHLTLPTNREV